MKKLISILSFITFLPLTPSWAQLLPPNEAGVTLGSWHTIVRDIEVTKRWWQLWGGVPMKIDGAEVMKMPGVFIFMTKGEPNRWGTRGSLIDHIAFKTPNCYALVKKVVADAGTPSDPINLKTMRLVEWKPGSGQRECVQTYNTDGLRVEIVVDEDLPESTDKNELHPAISSDMIHYYYKDLPELRAAYHWYHKYFGGHPSPAAAVNDIIPGTKLNYVTADGVSRPRNKGGPLDHIGFEIKDLPAFVKKMEADGVKFDEPYSKTRHKSYASAKFTDPFGTVVELTEGLNKF